MAVRTKPAVPASDYIDSFLEAGDHLTREEFHRRYLLRPDIKKAELIDGVVYVPSPVRIEFHSEPHGDIAGWLYTYKAIHGAVRLSIDGTVILAGENEVQPDACLWLETPDGPRVTEDNYLEGPPQLLVEVAASSANYDLHEKKEAYRRNGVREYIVWRVIDKAIDWFELRDGAYILRAPDEAGIIESAQFPGLRLSVPSMLAALRPAPTA
jgi:Uma2 family endonuclease